MASRSRNASALRRSKVSWIALGLLPLSCASISGSPGGISVARTEQRDVIVESNSKIKVVPKEALAVSDSVIEVPANFDTRGLETCRGVLAEPLTCPLRKRIIRVYVRNVEAKVSGAELVIDHLRSINSVRLSEWLADFIARSSRFHVISRDDDLVNFDRSVTEARTPEKNLPKIRSKQEEVAPDIILRVDAIKSSSFIYRANYGEVTYGLELSCAFIDPNNRILLDNPRVPAIARRSEPLKFVEVNGKYYTGHDYVNSGPSVFQEISGQAFRVVVNALLNNIPAVGRITAMAGDRIALDRGAEAGIFPHETMVIFEDRQGVPEPIAIANIQPAQGRSVGVIFKWKDSRRATELREASARQTLDGIQYRIFAVSVGASATYSY